jgi:hypothetical protein
MSEKRVYQEKMLSSEKEIVICNWERQKGKTYSIFRKIMENKNGKYLYISPFNSIALKDCFKEYTYKRKDTIKLYKSSRDNDSIEFNDGNKIEVFYVKPNTQFRGCRNIKIAFFDECYINKEYIDSILKPMDVKQVYCMITNDNIEYIDSRQIKNDFTTKEFYDIQIKELMEEYAETPKNKNTTLSRENILKQIKVLQDMKRGN